MSDPDDYAILATAVAGHASIIVSLNTRDFPMGGAVLGVRYLAPWALLSDLATILPGDEIERQARETGRLIP